MGYYATPNRPASADLAFPNCIKKCDSDHDFRVYVGDYFKCLKTKNCEVFLRCTR
jgi:hypothetical protein